MFTTQLIDEAHSDLTAKSSRHATKSIQMLVFVAVELFLSSGSKLKLIHFWPLLAIIFGLYLTLFISSIVITSSFSLLKPTFTLILTELVCFCCNLHLSKLSELFSLVINCEDN